MKSLFFLKFLCILTLAAAVACGGEKKTEPVEVPVKDDVSSFLGQWTIDINGGGVGWLEVRQENGYIDADLLWGGGSVLPVPYVYVAGNTLIVGRNEKKDVRLKDENGNETRAHLFPTWVEIQRDGEDIRGIYLRPKSGGVGLDSTLIKGRKLPDVPPAPDLSKVKFGEPVQLFNGKDLTGWKLVEENKANGWSVIDGVLVNDPVQKEGSPHINYGNLRTEKEFEDFNIKMEVNVPENGNSGVYLRGRHEIQVSDTYGRPLNPHNMGALYSRVTPSVNAEKKANEWQTLEITLCDRHVTVLLNGINIIDNKPVYGPTGGALTSDVFAPGPIYLQGDHRKVAYRNIVLTPIVK